MKNLFQTSLAFLLFCSVSNAQLVDKSINGVQTGFLGIWWNNESKLAHRWALRTEIGYSAPINEGGQYTDEFQNKYSNFYPTFRPVVSLEPRWYYNSKKRQGNSNNTFHNSGNYATIAIQYYSNHLVYSPTVSNDERLIYDEIRPNADLFLIPTWGIRRNISYRWNFEMGAGFGVDLIKAFGLRSESLREVDNTGDNDFIFNVHLRIGYKYGMKE